MRTNPTSSTAAAPVLTPSGRATLASALALAAALATSAGCIGADAEVEGDEPDPTAISSRADASTFVDKVTAGYQAWFGCPTSDLGTNWTHWSYGNNPEPGRISFELYPDVSEYDPRDLCDTNLGNLGNGQRARLYNAAGASVIDTHLRWMAEYGIDGIGVQRFVVGLGNPTRSYEILRRIRAAAERHGRIYYVMYDISGAGEATWAEDIKRDWLALVEGGEGHAGSPQYAHQDGKPVVNVWGIGSGDRPGTGAQALELIRWFQARGVYVAGGVPYSWRSPGGAKPGFEEAFAALDLVQPWSVGTFASRGDLDGHFSDLVPGDVALTDQRGQAYQRVIWPGFAWSNWNAPPQNGIPRRAGDFFWSQAYHTARLGTGAYFAMFDEYDEGTALAKAAVDRSQTPSNQYFLTLDADGTRVSSDFYLRLAGAATKMIRGEAPVTAQVPIERIPGEAPPVTSRLAAGAWLPAGGSLTSSDGRFVFTYQGDGNLVLYQQGAPIWASGTGGAAGRVTMQDDGNLVVSAADGAVVWSSGSGGHPGAALELQNDGNVVIYAAGEPVWSTGTAGR